MLVFKVINSKLILILLTGLFFLSSHGKLHCSPTDDVKEQLWQKGSHVVHASYKWEDAVSFICQNEAAIKNWASDTTPRAYCSLIYQAPWGRIWSLSYFYSLNTLFVRDVVIPNFKENDYVLIPFWGQIVDNTNGALLKNAAYPENFFFLGNSDACTEVLRIEGLQAYTVSHNAFIDPQCFRPYPGTKKLYGAVYVGDCRPQKRLHLVSSVLSDLLVVTSNNTNRRKIIARAKQIITNPPQERIAYYMNHAHCGLILSESEGGCYASTEYLYSGIPVVSTHSIGGRDAYYDVVTALIVDATPESILEGINAMCNRKADPWEIRRRALAVSDQMLNTLAYDILLPIFVKYRDPHAKDPREFVDKIMNQSKAQSSKGRTLFQPERPTHDTIEKIQKAQRG